MASDLLKIARAINEPRLDARVKAAMFTHAAGSSYAAGTNDRKFANYILMNPNAGDPSMLAFVAADPAVLADVTLNSEVGDVPNTDNVDDADILRVVAAKWTLVATKFAAVTA